MKEIDIINSLTKKAHQNAIAHGWWEEERSFGELIALMHSELSEALEYDRKGNGQSDHIPEFTGVEEELADVVIRIFDYCGRKNLRLGEAVIAKMKFNESRPYKHGKKY
jgi:NTP pyrophosphatase (non-canonical NTP hydrolase)